jgi:hypothetical protein
MAAAAVTVTVRKPLIKKRATKDCVHKKFGLCSGMALSALSMTLMSACLAMQVNAFMTPVPMNMNAARILMR